MSKYTLLVIALVVCVCSAAGLPPIALRQKPTLERTFIDAYGRETFFHGVNAVVKGFPWVPSLDFNVYYSMSERDFQLLSQAGMNVIRLGTMWSGFEPVQGQYNYTYLEQISQIAAIGAKYGVYTLLDMHEDVLAEQFCGEGIPLWAVRVNSLLPFPALNGAGFNESQYENSTGYMLPTRQACALHSWGSYFAAEAVGSAYEALYTNQDGIADAWAKAWGLITKYFAGRTEILGVELFNEPWAGDIYKDILEIIPGVADKDKLQPVYDRLSASVRVADPERLVFFAGVTWDDFGAGFTSVPGGSEFANRSVFAFHLYVPPQFQNSQSSYFGFHLKDAQRLQSGWMMTEFGSPGYNSDFNNDTQAADNDLLSWIMWEWKDFCKETPETLNSNKQAAAYGACKTGYGGVSWNETTGQPDPSVMFKLSRAYAPYVAGTTQTMNYNPDTVEFKLVYTVDTAITMPTEIYVSEDMHYTSGVKVTFEPATWATYQHTAGSNKIYVNVNNQAVTGQSLTVTVTRA